MVSSGASNRPLWSCGESSVVRLQGRHYYIFTIYYIRTTDLSQCARKPCCQSWPCARLEVPEVAEVLGVLGASTHGCCCSSPTDPCHRQPSDLSSASHLKLKSFQSLCRTFLSVGERFLCFLQTDGRFIVLLTVKSHFSHFYRGWCRDFVISKKLSASVKWDLGAVRCNALNHEK